MVIKVAQLEIVSGILLLFLKGFLIFHNRSMTSTVFLSH